MADVRVESMIGGMANNRNKKLSLKSAIHIYYEYGNKAPFSRFTSERFISRPQIQ
jgi:hypothetical protein